MQVWAPIPISTFWCHGNLPHIFAWRIMLDRSLPGYSLADPETATTKLELQHFLPLFQKERSPSAEEGIRHVKPQLE